MKTFFFSEKNGNAVITLSEENQEKAGIYLAKLVKNPREFILDEIMEED